MATYFGLCELLRRVCVGSVAIVITRWSAVARGLNTVVMVTEVTIFLVPSNTVTVAVVTARAGGTRWGPSGTV